MKSLSLLRLTYGVNLLDAIRVQRKESGGTVRQAVAVLVRLQRKYGDYR